jgi:hypothetical protein
MQVLCFYESERKYDEKYELNLKVIKFSKASEVIFMKIVAAANSLLDKI